MLSIGDNQACNLQARVAEKATEKARRGDDLDIELVEWDEYMVSEKGKRKNKDTLLHLRDLIETVWVLALTYPELHPDRIGDYVYKACVDEKTKNPKLKF